MKQLIETKVFPATNFRSTRVRVRGVKGTRFYPFTYDVADEARNAVEKYLGTGALEELDAPRVPGVRYFTAPATMPSFPPELRAAIVLHDWNKRAN